MYLPCSIELDSTQFQRQRSSNETKTNKETKQNKTKQNRISKHVVNHRALLICV